MHWLLALMFCVGFNVRALIAGQLSAIFPLVLCFIALAINYYLHRKKDVTKQ
ncbi:hypothetical protein SDC9_78483 [bioreactor metagenome]|uniref:Uncharacterized protein n=1 Tax=bioreactor metagenome TaxID=1076179 RepID=A0A644YTT7_9ZZZZ